MKNWREKLRLSSGVIDTLLCILFVVMSIYAYDQYKEITTKTYVVDAGKIYKLKQATLDTATATEDDIVKYYDSFERIVTFSDAFINKVSSEKNTIVYSKNYVLTTKSKNVVDITDELILQLKSQKLL